MNVKWDHLVLVLLPEIYENGIYNYSSDSNMNAFANAKSNLPNLKNDGRMHVHLSGNHFQ